MTDSQSKLVAGQSGAAAFRVQRSDGRELPRYVRKKAQTRERIYRAAMKLFAERGLSATTVDEIVAVADVAKGTFFNYFRSKEEVFTALIEIQLAKLAEALQAVRHDKPSLPGVLRRTFRLLGEEMGGSPHLARALVCAILGNELARETIAAGMARGRQLLAGILRVGQKRGQVRHDRPPRTMSLAFQQALFGTLVLWAIRPQAELATLLDASFEDYWRCVAAGKRRAK